MPYHSRATHRRHTTAANGWRLLVLVALLVAGARDVSSGASLLDGECNAPFLSVSQPLNDLGPAEYIRLDEGPTGYIGGLYPGGANVRPPAHNQAGLDLAGQIAPLDAAGNYDPAGKIAFISVGLSNTSMEFDQFIAQASGDPQLNPQLVIVNGARGSLVSTKWTDPNAEAWDSLDQYLAEAGATPQQVQVAWVKLAQFGGGEFPEKAQSLQSDLTLIAQNLKIRYPNIKLAYHSSRTRAYIYWDGLSPEPVAFETAFSVRWLIEDQILGNPDLNYNPNLGAVMAPWLAWGPYLWIDGLNPRSDGLVWSPQDLQEDCVHPSESGSQKVAAQLMTFFKNDPTAAPWFLGSAPPPPPPNLALQTYLPLINHQTH